MTGVDAMLAEARAHLDRVGPREADELQRAGALLVDIRPLADRVAEGEIPGSVPVERIVLEWRLDPAGADRIDGVHAGATVVVLCNEGYASSLAVRDLRRLGLVRATDLVGGFRAWRAAGLPVRAGGTPPVP
ncbi:MAG: rhodanese-like domain-containing protein [Streptosporangiales bacterium]|nr:rhodanese-like domain-containing protein [Streptosporangiales bacterium]